MINVDANMNKKYTICFAKSYSKKASKDVFSLLLSLVHYRWSLSLLFLVRLRAIAFGRFDGHFDTFGLVHLFCIGFFLFINCINRTLVFLEHADVRVLEPAELVWHSVEDFLHHDRLHDNDHQVENKEE